MRTVTRPSTAASGRPAIPVQDGGREPDAAVAERADTPSAETGATNDLVELLFFAYRDFVGDPDRMLAEYSFGRAHHRVLHFVFHYPGLTIAELLDILRITKQSLNRVLKDLIEQGYIVQKTGRNDRRQRLLFCSDTGATLTAELTRVQVRRVARAIADPVADDARGAYAAAQGFLMAMIEPEERAAVRSLMARRIGDRA